MRCKPSLHISIANNIEYEIDPNTKNNINNLCKGIDTNFEYDLAEKEVYIWEDQNGYK
jgi:hypothetical protein